MVTWQRFADESPRFAEYVRERFEITKHHVLATIRSDGAPRVSGTEVHWRGPELELGSMPGAMKALDLRRDSRFAIHTNPGDGTQPPPLDAKISGHAREVVDPAEHRAWLEEVQPPSAESHLFRLDIEAVSTAEVDKDHMLIKLWRPGRDVVTFRRYG